MRKLSYPCPSKQMGIWICVLKRSPQIWIFHVLPWLSRPDHPHAQYLIEDLMIEFGCYLSKSRDRGLTLSRVVILVSLFKDG